MPVPVPARRGALTEPDNEVGVRESVRVRVRGTGLAHADVNGRGEPRLRALAGAVFSLGLFSLRERGKDTCTGTCLEMIYVGHYHHRLVDNRATRSTCDG